MWLVSKCPVRCQIAIGKTLGLMGYPFARRRRRIAAINLRLCFPELTEPQRRRLLRRHFAAMGAGFFEVTMGWWTPSRLLRSHVIIEGEQHLREALTKGKGVILLSAHFTPLEIGGRFLSMLCPDVHYCAMYRPHQNPLIEAMIKSNRERQFGTVVGRDDVRGIVRALKQNKAAWYAPDQTVPISRGKFVPFFGIPASTNTATPRLAKMSGASVIPFFCLRQCGRKTYTVKLLPPMQLDLNDPVAAMQQVHTVFEQQIRLAPEQYFWVHRRFKKRPNNEPSLYGK